MGLLTPLFLVGLAGLAVPVLLHLTRQERGKPVRFPSLMFLERMPVQEASRRRIRHWALLALRLAALALLVAAFARPFARDGGLAGVGGAGPEEIVLVLDQSYSMALAGHWEQAVSRAKEMAGELGPLDRVSLVAFAEAPHLLVRSSPSAAPVLQALDTLETSSLGTRIAPALKLAGSVLEASRLGRRRVALFSDFQRAGWRPDRDAALPEGTELQPVAIGGAEAGADNLALAGLDLRREPGAGRERVRVRARVTAVAASQDRETRVTLSVDGTDVETVALSVPAGGGAPLAFAPFTLAHPFTRGEVRLTDGVLEPDNVLHFVASPGGGPNVLVWDLRGTGESNLYLRGALESGGAEGFSTRITTAPPSAAQLDAADLVVLNGAPVPGGAAGDRLRAFVTGGGGLFAALGERSPFAADQAGFLPTTAGRVADAAREPRRLGFVDYDHPVFEAFRGPRSGDFSRTSFYRTRQVEANSGARALARFDDGSPALVEGRLGAGRILVWAGGLGRLWSDFPLQAVYLPFVHRAARYLGTRGLSPEWHRAGTTADLASLAEAAGAGSVSAGVVAMAPGGGSVPVDPEAPLLFLGGQGIWEIRPPGRRPDRPMALAANVDLAESDLARLDMEEFVVAAGGGGAALSASGTTAGDATVAAGEDFEERQGFWRYLLAGAFLMLASESALANWLSRARVA